MTRFYIYFRALFASIPMGVGFHLLNCVAGLVIYAYYADCDPMTAPNKPITSADQVSKTICSTVLKMV